MEASDRDVSAPDDRKPEFGCATCGTLAQANERFCRRCGEPLPGTLPPPPPPVGEMGASAGGQGTSTGRQATSEATWLEGEGEPLPTDPVGWPQPAPPTGSASVPCPACALLNPPARELCLRCGVDLETGERLPVPKPSYGDGPSDPVGLAPAAKRAWWIAPLAIVVVAGGLLAGLWVAEIGPFASEPELPSASFAAERYPVDETPQHLDLSDVATVTTRPPDGARTFPVEHIVDADPDTAWYSAPEELPQGVDEKIDLFLEEPAWVTQLVINNGDHADADTYEQAGRLQRALLVMDGDVHVELALLDLGREPQAISLPEPVLTTTVRLELREVLPGSGVDGVAVSDLELRGWPADATDSDIAVRRADVRQAAGSFTVPE